MVKAGENMDHCPKCNSLLRTGKSTMDFENDTTPDLPTIAYINIPMFCQNKECENYAGDNPEQPMYLVDVLRNKVN